VSVATVFVKFPLLFDSYCIYLLVQLYSVCPSVLTCYQLWRIKMYNKRQQQINIRFLLCWCRWSRRQRGYCS